MPSARRVPPKPRSNPWSFNQKVPPVQDLEAINADTLAPVLAWVAPRPDFYPAIPNLKLAVSHLPARKIELLHNGMPVSPLASDGIRNSGNGRIAISLVERRGLVGRREPVHGLCAGMQTAGRPAA